MYSNAIKYLQNVVVENTPATVTGINDDGKETNFTTNIILENRQANNRDGDILLYPMFATGEIDVTALSKRQYGGTFNIKVESRKNTGIIASYIAIDAIGEVLEQSTAQLFNGTDKAGSIRLHKANIDNLGLDADSNYYTIMYTINFTYIFPN